MAVGEADPISARSELGSIPIPQLEPLARRIHDNILQTLGIALLQAELCRRFWGQTNDGQGATELAVLLDYLQDVVEMFRAIMETLRQAVIWTRARSA